MQEIRDKVDVHADNQKTFGFTGTHARRTAKIFVFRLIYGGQAYSYAHDSDFNFISHSVDYWQKVVDKFYQKYTGIAKWHDELVKQVLDSGQLVMPTGRIYAFDRADVAKRLWFHRPKILNYPVQGLGADLVAIGRVALWKRLKNQGLPVKFISTVHDSVDLDVNISREALDKDPTLCYTICRVVKQAFEDVPVNFKSLFGSVFDLPISVEIGYGQSLATLLSYKD